VRKTLCTFLCPSKPLQDPNVSPVVSPRPGPWATKFNKQCSCYAGSVMKNLQSDLADSISRVVGHQTGESRLAFSVQRPDKSLHPVGDKTRNTLRTHTYQNKSHQPLCLCAIRKELAPKTRANNILWVVASIAGLCCRPETMQRVDMQMLGHWRRQRLCFSTGNKSGKRRHRNGLSVLSDQLGELFAHKQALWFL